MPKRILRITTLACVVSGCTVGPNYHPPKTHVPEDWSSPATQPSTRASIPTTQATDVAQWWRTLNDPTLDLLIHRAIQSNLNLRQAEARIRQARAARGVTAS